MHSRVIVPSVNWIQRKHACVRSDLLNHKQRLNLDQRGFLPAYRLSMRTFRVSNFFAQSEGMPVRDLVHPAICSTAAAVEKHEIFATLNYSVSLCNTAFVEGALSHSR